MSVDALRGFDMFWIIGAGSLVEALNQMSGSTLTRFLAEQLDHVEWEGFHFEDLIFPLFVFIVGVSMVFSLTRILEQGGRRKALLRVARRTILLYALGIICYGGMSNSWPDIRLMGVLNRIALCYGLGSLLFCYVRPRGLAVTAIALLLAYWAALAWIPFPDVRPTPGGNQVITRDSFPDVTRLNMASTNLIRGSYLQGVNLANYVDQKYLPGYKWDGTYDPEGLLSTIPAVVSCLLGVLAGLLLRSAAWDDHRKVLILIGSGVGALLAGFLWGTQLPIIKKIWTSSYVLVAGGYSAILLGAFYWLVDVKGYRKWCQPFVWIGMNSITIYMVNNFLGGFDKLASRLVGGDVAAFFDQHLAQGMGSLIVALVGLALAIWFVQFLHSRKVFIRL